MDNSSSTGHMYENAVRSGVNPLQSFDLYGHVGTAGKITEHTHSAEFLFPHAFTRFAPSHGNAFLLLDESIRKQTSKVALLSYIPIDLFSLMFSFLYVYLNASGSRSETPGKF